MAATNINAQSLVRNGAVVIAAGAAADASNGNQSTPPGPGSNVYLLLTNSDSGASHTVTLNVEGSARHPSDVEGNTVFTIAESAQQLAGPFDTAEVLVEGVLYFTASSAEIKVNVLFSQGW